MILRKIYEKLFRRFRKANYKDSLIKNGQLNCNSSSNIEGLRVVLRIPEMKEFISIGKNSLVKGSFIFENDMGYIRVGDRTFIGGGNFISIEKIEIGSDVLISWGCTFMDNDAHSLNWSERKNDVIDWIRGVEEGAIGKYKKWDNVGRGPICIEDKVWIGFDVVVLKGVKIGEGAIVGSRSVVTKDVPNWTVVAGNPAKVIREIPEHERA